MSDIDTAELGKRANALLALHKPGDPVVLPTVWDAWSAALAVDAGFAALTVGSHPVADSVGKPDGEGMTFDDLLTRVAQITAKVDVPISVDIESGLRRRPAATDRRTARGRRGRAQHRGHRAFARASDCARPRSTRRWSARCAKPPTPRACMW